MASQLNMDKFNEFINNANNTLSCDSECQKAKKSEELKNKYLDAQVNLQSAPAQLQTTFKNYVTFTQGGASFNEQNNQNLDEKANLIADTFENSFDESMVSTRSSLDTYEGLLLNFSHVVELYTKIIRENIMLANKIRLKSSDVLTNNRKTYYEDQNIETLGFWNSLFLYFYIAVIIAFIISIFVMPKKTSWKVQVAILIGLIAYPFFSLWLLNLVTKIWNSIIGVLPKNVYKDI